MTILLIILAIVAVFFIIKLFKVPKIGCLGMVTGGVKCGKSMLSVWLAKRKYKSQLRKWRIRCFFRKIFARKKPLPEKPVLYSNVKLAGVKYSLLTTEMILRKVRPAYGSVVYIQEASLLADSMYFKDMEVNERLLLFNKLFGHETHGGYLIYDTQSIQDNHYAVKRCINSYFWIHHNIKIPFFVILYVREFFFSEDNSTINTVDSDVEDDLKRILIPKRVWKMYDAYCYSAFTDNLPVAKNETFTPIRPFRKADLKTRKIISLKQFRTIEEYKPKKAKEQKTDDLTNNENKNIVQNR